LKAPVLPIRIATVAIETSLFQTAFGLGTVPAVICFREGTSMEIEMKYMLATLAVSALLAGPALAIDNNNARNKAPGQQMQDKGSVKGTTGASGYAPGQQMQEKGSVKGTTGASGYAPGRSTSGPQGRK
jgi:hypothetical protein